MLSTSFTIATIRKALETHNWRVRDFSPCAEEVLEGYGEAVHYAVERCVASREDYEVESYECLGDLFVFQLVEGTVFVDYYKLDEETYERSYKGLALETMPQRVLRALSAALEA